MTNRVLSTLLLLVLLACVSCDNDAAIHEPDWSLNRMNEQPSRADPYENAMREPPRGTIPTTFRKVERGDVVVTRALLERGRSRFETFCAACHGVLGDGQTVVASRMSLRRPPSFMESRLLRHSADEIVEIIEQGFGLMPSYVDAINDPRDRWAVAHYVKTLQLARTARVAELSPDERTKIERGSR